MYHSTNPPGIDRLAEPDPRRASRESSRCVRMVPTARLAAKASAANADAEEAIPVPEGKLFSLTTSARLFIPAIWRTRSRKRPTRSNPGPATCFSPMRKLSALRDAENVTVVRVNNPSRFIEMEPLSGRRSAWFRLPQYLMSAIFGWLRAVAV